MQLGIPRADWRAHRHGKGEVLRRELHIYLMISPRWKKRSGRHHGARKTLLILKMPVSAVHERGVWWRLQGEVIGRSASPSAKTLSVRTPIPSSNHFHFSELRLSTPNDHPDPPSSTPPGPLSPWHQSPLSSMCQPLPPGEEAQHSRSAIAMQKSLLCRTRAQTE